MRPPRGGYYPEGDRDFRGGRGGEFRRKMPLCTHMSTIITRGRECQMHAKILPHSSFFSDFVRYGSS
jgi:hypothetical protein